MVNHLAKSTGVSSGSKQLPSLSLELIGIIADFLFELYPPRHSGNVESDTICCVKPPWCNVKGFMQASPETHKMGFERWVSALTIREPQDWEISLESPRLIRELVCLANTILPTNNSILSRFPQLRALCVDTHEEFQPTTDVFSELPPTVRHLEIKHAHGPDIKIISRVKRDCPDLESLWLGRCTMLNRTPACSFWEAYPLDHDSYMSSEGTDAYANLHPIRFGIYIVPSTIVLVHRLFHPRDLPIPPIINWQTHLVSPHIDQNEQGPQVQPQLAQNTDLVALLHQAPEEETCDRCWQEFSAGSQSAEIRATITLKEALPNLKFVEWMDWFSPYHLGIFLYNIETSRESEAI